MHARKLGSVIFGIVLALAAIRSAEAQCLDWSQGFGVDGVRTLYGGRLLYGRPSGDAVDAFAVFDDGSGPVLYVAGTFAEAGGVLSSGLVRWNGSSWSPVDAQPDAQIHTMAVFDDGSGPALYVGGSFTTIGGTPASRIAKWGGSAWSEVGGGVTHPNPPAAAVRALTVFDDGTGPALYVGGSFVHAGALQSVGVARWDGSAWTSPAGGVNGNVRALLASEDASGPVLYVGGGFDSAGGVPANDIASWNGTAWSALGGGLGLSVETVAVFDDGSGPALYAGGSFGEHLARWDGVDWLGVGTDVDGNVKRLAVFDDGTGAKLFAAGEFTNAGGVAANHVASWDGAGWSALGSGLSDFAAASDPARCWAVYDDGGGPDLYLGGAFVGAGGVGAYGIARWNGSSWSSVSDGSSQGTERIRALATFDDGTGTVLVAGGTFVFAGGTPANNVARWDGSAWSPLGAGLVGVDSVNDAPLDAVHTLATFDSGSGPELYAGGSFFDLGGGTTTGRVARWNGSSWGPLMDGVSGFGAYTQVHALCAYDTGGGPSLYAGGWFTSASGVAASYIARWDGASWSAVGGGMNQSVHAMAVFDDGTGPALYAGGWFDQAGGQPASCIARWDGTSWTPLGLGLDGPFGIKSVHALAVFDDGTGPALYVGGSFMTAGGIPATNVARWDGAAWSALGEGLCSPPASFPDETTVSSLAVFDDGLGPSLYAGGFFTCSGSKSLSRIAKWDGASWMPLGDGIGSSNLIEGTQVFALCGYEGAAGGPRLYAGGRLQRAGSIPSAGIAAWRGCSSAPGVPFCAGDGTIRPCPCANNGAPGHGCENSASTGGATLATNGSTHPDTVVLATEGERASALTVFIQGSASIAPVLYGDGLRCVSGQLKRLYSRNAIDGSTSAPRDGDLPITQRSAMLGDPIAPGSTRHYQAYYRDPNPMFCPMPTGSTFNVTNGVTIQW